MQRRLFLLSTIATGAIALLPRMAFSAWPKAAFEAKTLQGVLHNLFADAKPIESSAIRLEMQEIAQSGAVVPITVSSTLDNVSAISIVVEKNPSPLAARFTLPPGTEPYVATRIKMGETSRVIALVQSGDKLYSASMEVKVTIGGCGG